jgi:hypothetical protein
MTNGKQKRAESLKELAGLGKEGFAKPSTFYRHLHPELFSDSRASKKVLLTKALLEFHLDQLTVNKKEYEFEEFCLRLAEREICSNLIPQTGPVGGGDSKVDASTYPVAAELREQRYWNGKAKPTGEEWAFAFSAKKAWQDKARADIAKIAGVPRKFQKAFFMTNQPAREKVRAKLEAELSSNSGMHVSILDRTWIVRKVLENRLEELAMSCLGLDAGTAQERQRGPRDTAAEQRLHDLLQTLQIPEQAPRSKYALAQDFLEAAKGYPGNLMGRTGKRRLLERKNMESAAWSVKRQSGLWFMPKMRRGALRRAFGLVGGGDLVHGRARRVPWGAAGQPQIYPL